MPAGRPAIYSPELAAEVCRRIAEGESLRQVCRDESMPSRTTVLKWAREIKEFAVQYVRAREDLLEHWAEEILEISDDGSRDYIGGQVAEGVTAVDHDHISRSRLRVDSRKWLLSKLAPKKYGDRVTNTHVGDDDGPIKVESKLQHENLDIEQLRALASIPIHDV